MMAMMMRIRSQDLELELELELVLQARQPARAQHRAAVLEIRRQELVVRWRASSFML
jgi:hypothetical protein